jgi:putative ABC transport system permease protein
MNDPIEAPYTAMSRRARYLLTWPLANVRHTPWTSLATVVAVGAAAYIAATLFGFVAGYQVATEEDVDRLGYDLLITAKGCPYEAATLMLRGGVGLQYMPAGVVTRLRAEAEVAATFPMLIHPIKAPGDSSGMALLKGVDTGWRDSLKLELLEGSWFEETPEGLQGEGVVLGFEAAELEKRRAGDPYLLYNAKTKAFDTTSVRGILARTGTQVDGTVLLPLPKIQAAYDLPGKLTGVGVRVRSEAPDALDRIRDRYNLEPALQVVSLSRIEATLREAMSGLRDVVSLMAVALALLAGLVLLNTTVLRTLSEHRRLYTLQVIGVPAWFLAAAAMMESALLALVGAGVGLGLAAATGGWASACLVTYLPYAPKGDLIALSSELQLTILATSLALAILATLPPVARVLWFSSLSSLREG